MLKEEEIFSHSNPLPISPLSHSPTPPLPDSPTPHFPSEAMLKAELVGVLVSTAAATSMPAGSI
jgi:hypothetical protein